MNLGDIYGYLNTMLDKHSSGNKFTITEFNYLIESEVLNFVDDQVEEAMKASLTPKDYMQRILSSKVLKKLIKNEVITLTPTYYVLSELAYTFGYFVGMKTNSTYHGKVCQIELVNLNEYIDRQSNMLKPNIYYNPICTLMGDTSNSSEIETLHFLPIDIGEVVFYYLKLPDTPFFDYYIDVNRNTVFMPEGTSVDLDVITGTYRDGSTAGTQASITTELDIDQQSYPKFIEYLLSRLGVKSTDQILFQSAENEQAKDKKI